MKQVLNSWCFFFRSKILIEAVRGNGFHGDIGIDDIVITNGKCGSKFSWINGRMNEWMNELMNERMNELVSEWMNKSKNEWMWKLVINS